MREERKSEFRANLHFVFAQFDQISSWDTSNARVMPLLLPPASPVPDSQDSFAQLFINSPAHRHEETTTTAPDDSLTMDGEDSGGLTRLLAAGNASMDDFLLNESVLGQSFELGAELDRTRIDGALKSPHKPATTLSVEIQRTTSTSTISNKSTALPLSSRPLSQVDPILAEPDKPIRSVPLPTKITTKFSQQPVASTSTLSVPSLPTLPPPKPTVHSQSSVFISPPLRAKAIPSIVPSTSLPTTTTAPPRPKYVVEMRSDDMFARRRRDSGNRGIKAAEPQESSPESSFESSAGSLPTNRKLNIFTSTPARSSYAPEPQKQAMVEQAKGISKSESRLSVCFDPPTRAFENDFSLGDVDAIERDGRMMENSLEENTMEIVEEVTIVEPVVVVAAREVVMSKLEVRSGLGETKRRASRVFIEPPQKIGKLSSSEASPIDEDDVQLPILPSIHLLAPIQPRTSSNGLPRPNPIRRPSRAFASSRPLPDLPSSSPHTINRYLPAPRSNAIASSSTAKYVSPISQRPLDDLAIRAAERDEAPRPVAPARIVKPIPTSNGGGIARATLSSSLAQRVKVVVAPLKSSLKRSLATTDGGIASAGGKSKSKRVLTLPRGFEFSEGTGAGEMKRKREADREREKEDTEREEEMAKRAKSTQQRLPRSRPSTSIARTFSHGDVGTRSTRTFARPIAVEMERSLSIPLTEEALQQNEFDISDLGAFDRQLAQQRVEEERRAHLKRRVTCFIEGIVEEDDPTAIVTASRVGKDESKRAGGGAQGLSAEWGESRAVLGVAKSSNIVVSHSPTLSRIAHATDTSGGLQQRPSRSSVAHLSQPSKISTSKPPGFRGSENHSLSSSSAVLQKRQERVEWEAKQREREAQAAKSRELQRIEAEVRFLACGEADEPY